MRPGLGEPTREPLRRHGEEIRRGSGIAHGEPPFHIGTDALTSGIARPAFHGSFAVPRFVRQPRTSQRIIIYGRGSVYAGENPGQFTVHAKADGIEAIAEVRITMPSGGENGGRDDGGAAGGRPHAHAVYWEGEVPPQKWMNFYTKVLSRFVNTPGLKLTVRFGVPMEGDKAHAKADEARGGLRDLGLEGDVDVR